MNVSGRMKSRHWVKKTPHTLMVFTPINMANKIASFIPKSRNFREIKGLLQSVPDNVAAGVKKPDTPISRLPRA
jgi:hypothetical protein